MGVLHFVALRRTNKYEGVDYQSHPLKQKAIIALSILLVNIICGVVAGLIFRELELPSELAARERRAAIFEQVSTDVVLCLLRAITIRHVDMPTNNAGQLIALGRGVGDLLR